MICFLGIITKLALNAEMIKKGKDKCVTGKESDCSICAGSLKIPHKKKSSKSKSSDKCNDSILVEPLPSRSTPSTPDTSLQDLIKTRAVSWPLLLPSLRSLCEKTNLPLLREILLFHRSRVYVPLPARQDLMYKTP